MDVMLGVSVVGADARIALLDAAAPHDVIDQSSVDLSAEPVSALVSTLVSTDRMLAESGHRVVATRICDSDPEQAKTLVNALVDADMADVTAVARPDALIAAVRSLAAGETVASLSSEGDTAALSIVDSDTDTTSLIAVEPIRQDDHASAYRALLERFSEEPGGATSVIVLGAPAASQWATEVGAASTVPLRFPDEPEFILARGAALAALSLPSAAAALPDLELDAAETMLSPQAQQLAYSEVDDTGGLDTDFEYADTDVPLQTPMRPLSAIDPEEVEDDGATAAAPRPKMLLLGSTVAAVVVVGFAALAVSVAISIRPTATQQAIRMQDETVPGKYFPVTPGQGVTPDGPNWTAIENTPPPGVDTGGVRTFQTKALNLSGNGADAVVPRVIQIYRDGTVGVPDPQALVPVPPDPLTPDIPQAVPDFVPRLIPDLSKVDMTQVLSVLGNMQENPAKNVEAAQDVSRVVPLTDMVNPNNGLGLKDLGLVAAVPSNRGALFSTDQPKSAVSNAGAIPAEIFQTGKTGVDAAQVLPPDTKVIEALPAPAPNGKPGGAPIFGSAIPDLGAVLPNPAGVAPGAVKPALGTTPDVTAGLPDVLPKPDVPQQLPGVLPLPGLSPKPDVTPQLPNVLPLPDLSPKPVVKAPVPDVSVPEVKIPNAPIQVPQVKIPDAPVQVPQVKIPDPPVSVPEPPVSVPEPVFKLPIPVFNVPAPAAPSVPVPEAPSAPSVPLLPQIPLLPQLPFGGSGGGLFGSGSG